MTGGVQKDGLPKQIEGNRRLEIGWTLAPAIVLGVVFIISARVLGIISYQPATYSVRGIDPPPVHVRIVGHQWWWQVEYPDLHIMTANEIHVPVNTVIDIDLESVDVIHSFWVPQLAGKIDAIPGHVNHTWFVATQTGTFKGQCAEYCGIEHADMRLGVIVDSSDQYQAWVSTQQSLPAAVSGAAATGEQDFLNGACVGCHTVAGTSANGKIGPDLSHFGSRLQLAGEIMDNTPQNLAAWLADPQKVKPGTKMPNLGLTSDQVSALVAYLESLK